MVHRRAWSPFAALAARGFLVVVPVEVHFGHAAGPTELRWFGWRRRVGDDVAEVALEGEGVSAVWCGRRKYIELLERDHIAPGHDKRVEGAAPPVRALVVARPHPPLDSLNQIGVKCYIFGGT